MSFILKYTSCCPECKGAKDELCSSCLGCGVISNKGISLSNLDSAISKIIKIKEAKIQNIQDRKRVLAERMEISSIKTKEQESRLGILDGKIKTLQEQIDGFERLSNITWLNSLENKNIKFAFVSNKTKKQAKHIIDIGPQLRQIINEVAPKIADVAKKFSENLLGRKKQYVVWSGTVKMPLSPKLLKNEYLVIKAVWDVKSARRSSSGYYAVEEMPVEKRYYNVIVVNTASVGTDIERIESVLTHEISHASDPKKYHQHFIEGVEEAALQGNMRDYHGSKVEFDAYTGDIIERIRRIVDALVPYPEHKEKLHKWLYHILVCLRRGDLECALDVVKGTSASGFVFSIAKIEPLKRLAIQRIATVVQESFRKLKENVKI